jgi:hypothetical protein
LERAKKLGADWIQWIPLECGENVPGSGTLTVFPLPDQGRMRSFGFRLDWPGHSIAYVTDTYAEPTVDYVDESFEVWISCCMTSIRTPELGVAKAIFPETQVALDGMEIDF